MEPGKTESALTVDGRIKKFQKKICALKSGLDC